MNQVARSKMKQVITKTYTDNLYSLKVNNVFYGALGPSTRMGVILMKNLHF